MDAADRFKAFVVVRQLARVLPLVKEWMGELPLDVMLTLVPGVKR